MLQIKFLLSLFSFGLKDSLLLTLDIQNQSIYFACPSKGALSQHSPFLSYLSKSGYDVQGHSLLTEAAWAMLLEYLLPGDDK